jgi:hypothetical protein
MTSEEQPGFDPRLAWASQGGTLLAGACPVLVVVDILRFTTAVDVAVAHGALVIPERWAGREGPGDAGRAAQRPDPDAGSTVPSLSPVSILGIPAGTRVALASPNGATVTLDPPSRRSSTQPPTWHLSWPPASPAANSPTAGSPPTYAWPPSTTSARRSRACPVVPSLS